MEQKIVRRRNVKPLLIGLAVGAATGAAIGVLLAPRSGKQTRHTIGEAAHKVRAKFTKHPVESTL